MVRIKHRYLLVNFLYPDNFAPKTDFSTPAYLRFHSPTPSQLGPGLLISYLRNSISLNFGDCGLGLTTGSLKVIYLSHATSTAIIRCSRQHFRLVWAALTLINELPSFKRGEPGRKCVLQVARVSGTIRKSEEELLRRSRAHIIRAKLADEAQQSSVLDHFTTSDKAVTGHGLEANLFGTADMNIDVMSEDDEVGD